MKLIRATTSIHSLPDICCFERLKRVKICDMGLYRFYAGALQSKDLSSAIDVIYWTGISFLHSLLGKGTLNFSAPVRTHPRLWLYSIDGQYTGILDISFMMMMTTIMSMICMIINAYEAWPLSIIIRYSYLNTSGIFFYVCRYLFRKNTVARPHP